MPGDERPQEAGELNDVEVAALLRVGEIEIVGLFPDASNYTFAVEVRDGDRRTFAVYKPQRGEAPLWDFPSGTLYRREIAAYELSVSLGWDLVPVTIERDAVHGVGSLQRYVECDPQQHYLTLMPRHADEFRLVAAFDLIANNADRKSGHCMIERATGRIWVVDHGVCFHEEPKLRTVIWDFVGEPIPQDALADIARVAGELSPGCPLHDRLAPLLSAGEIDALRGRARALLADRVFPPPPADRRAYPWPPV